MTTPSSGPPTARAERRLQAQLDRQFAPLDKRALGMSIGVMLSVAFVAITVASLLLDRERQFPLRLLSQFLFGYTVSWVGAGIAALWGFIYGFLFGWLLAFGRNFVIAFWLIKARIRADVAGSQDFLDEI